MQWWSKQQLYVKIFICIIIGAVLGLTLGTEANFIFKPIGDVFIRLLKMLIVPVIFFTVVNGITKMESIKSLRSVGGKLVGYYVVTSLIAAIIGVAAALIINPGASGVSGLIAGNSPKIEFKEFDIVETLVNWIPTNPFEAFVKADVLQILFFSVIFGISLLLLENRVSKLNAVIEQAAETMIKVTDLVMQFSPYGILALIATMVNSLSASTLAEVGKFILADYAAILVVMFLVYPLQLYISKISTLKFYQAITPALIIAASTTSSAATLPVALNVAERNLKLPEKIYGFGLTVGATINTNGMAAAIGVIGVFACNVYGMPITLSVLFQIVFLGLMLSMGAAGVKGAGIVLSATLLQTLGLPLELVSIFAAIWPVIDIAHTSANVVGDLVGVSIIAANEGEMDVQAFNESTIDKE